MSEKQWHSEASVAQMRKMLRADFMVLGSCIIDPLRHVGESCGVHVFKTQCGTDREMVFRVTPDMDYTVEVKATQHNRRIL